MTPRTILVIKLRYIGDVLLTTPVLHALRDRWPEARMTMLVNPGTEDVVRWNPDLTEVLTVPRAGWGASMRFVHELRRRRFDLVIDLTDGDRAAFLAWWTGAPIRIGFNEERRWRGRLYTTVVDTPKQRHRIERDLETLRPLGLAPKPVPPILRTAEDDERRAEEVLRAAAVLGKPGRQPPLVMLHPGARYWFKAWPADRFAEVADRLIQTYGCRVIIGGGVQERVMADELVRRLGVTVIDVAGRIDLLTFAAVLKRCALLICNDNGAMHMAAALGVPVVALFGPSDPAEWGPRTDHAIVLYKHLDCRACFHPTCLRGEENCMRQITVDEVFRAACRLLGEREPVHVG